MFFNFISLFCFCKSSALSEVLSISAVTCSKLFNISARDVLSVLLTALFIESGVADEFDGDSSLLLEN